MELFRSHARRAGLLLVLSFALMALPFLGPVAIRCGSRMTSAAMASINRVLVPDWYTPDTF